MQQFLRASTYMLPVSMVLANIYQPYKVCLAMFSCYLFQHGLFIWKLFLVISILTVTSFKWLFFFVKSQDTVMHNVLGFVFCFLFLFFAAFYLQNLSLYWLGLLAGCTHVAGMQTEELILSIWGLLPDSCCFSVASKPPLNLSRNYPLLKNLCP